jgi:hypothetical protein
VKAIEDVARKGFDNVKMQKGHNFTILIMAIKDNLIPTMQDNLKPTEVWQILKFTYLDEGTYAQVTLFKP